MTMSLNDIIRYREEKAFQTFKEAEANMWNGVANRLYYACFYMVSGLLLKENLLAKSHSGAKVLFQKHFIKTGLIPDDLGRLYQNLFDLRSEGDYEDMVNFTASDLSPLLPQVETFLNQIKLILDTN